MRSLESLLVEDDRGIDRVRDWMAQAEHGCEALPPSEHHEEVLLGLQVTTRSTMGAIAYETGGVLVDGGWLRILGSGHSRLPRRVSLMATGKGAGMVLMADDAVGGFFALNGGALGDDLMNVYFWPPDGLDWEPLEVGYTDFFRWSLTSGLSAFYETLRWRSWRHDLLDLGPDQCFAFYPFLWSREGSVEGSHREPVPVQEAFKLKLNFLEQMG